MTALAGQAATALDNARLFTQERDRKASLTSLLEINKKIGALATPESLLTSIAEEAARLLDVDNAGFRLLEGDDLVVAGLAGTAGQSMLRARIKVGESLTGRVFTSGQALMCELEESGILADHMAADRNLGYTHYLGVPLMVGERAIGVLTFRGRRAFTAREQELGETFAGQAAIAIDHSRLYREASEQAERMRVVAEMGRVLVSTLDEARVLEIVGTQAHESLGSLDIAIWLQEVDGGPLHLVTGQGMFSGPLSGRAQPLNADEGVVGRALAERAPVWTADVLNDSRMQLRPESRRWIEEVGGRSILAVPLVREHLAGALVVYRPVGQVFTRREVEYLSAFANQIAVALENARLYKTLDVRVRELAVLHELSRSVTGQLDRARILDTLHQQVPRLLGVHHMAVVLLDEERTRLEVVLRVRDGRRCDEEEPRSYPLGQSGLTTVVLETGRPIRSTDYLGECRRHGVAPVPNAMNMPHVLIVPMHRGRPAARDCCCCGARIARSPRRDERLLANIAQLARAHAPQRAPVRGAHAGATASWAPPRTSSCAPRSCARWARWPRGWRTTSTTCSPPSWAAPSSCSSASRTPSCASGSRSSSARRWTAPAPCGGCRTSPASAATSRRWRWTSTRWSSRSSRPRSRSGGRTAPGAGASRSRWRPGWPRSLPPVAGDPAELREAFTNLVLNAVDAMPKGGTLTLRTRRTDGQVEVRGARHRDGHSRARPARRSSIRSSRPRGRRAPASASRWPMVSSSATAAGSRVESEEGRGTIFRLLFPAAVSGSVEAAAPPLAARPGAVTSLRCLVVDDEAGGGRGAGRHPRHRRAHRGDRRGAARTRWSRSRAERFDVVFTDLAMPGMTGWEVARAVKDRAPEVPVVLVSGFGVEVAPEDLPARGVDAVLAKPLEIQDVLRTLAAAPPAE